jgi:hypothetical protein
MGVTSGKVRQSILLKLWLGRAVPFMVQRQIGGWRFVYLPAVLCAFAVAAEPPLVPLTVCEVLHDLASNEGKTVAVVGRYSYRENGRWMGEQACDAGSAAPPLLWLMEDSNDGPIQQRTSLGKFRFGTPDYDRWAVIYGRVETRKAEAAKQAPANLVFRGSGVVVFLALQQ